MKKLLIFIIAIVLISCKKQKPDIPSFYTVADFQPMSVGSYWIYRQYNVDTNNVRTPLERMDSLVVENDTLINGNTFAKFVNYPLNYNVPPTINAFRDSSGYLINSWGFIVFGISNSMDTLYAHENNFEFVYTKMTGIDSLITVEVGTFVTRTLGEYYFFKLGNGELVPINPQTFHSYAPHVGQIATTRLNFTMQSYAIERRLVRYHIVN
jgi:hypothetical protein